jgi:peptidoglycan/LPS O-acetylase OafA/YrhL
MVTRNDYLQGLTGIRGFAAVWVLVYHTWTFFAPLPVTVGAGGATLELTPFFSLGWAGVDVFFVLSGFVLALPFVRAQLSDAPRPSFRVFFQRRVLRVIPAYFAQLLILIPLALAGKLGDVPSLPNIAAHLALAHNFSQEYSGAINTPYWTMPIEWDFYLAFPLLILWLKPGRWAWLAGLSIAATIAYRLLIYATPSTRPLLEQFPGRSDQFIFGMIGAYAFLRSAAPDQRRERAADLMALFAVAAAIGLMYLLHYRVEEYFRGEWTLYTWHTLFGAASAVLLVAVAWNGRIVTAVLANRAMVGLGAISYSIYLWHYPLLLWIKSSGWAEGAAKHGMMLMLPLALAVVVPVAYISYHFIERPFHSDAPGRLPRLIAYGRANPWIFFSACAALLLAWSVAWQAWLK